MGKVWLGMAAILALARAAKGGEPVANPLGYVLEGQFHQNAVSPSEAVWEDPGNVYRQQFGTSAGRVGDTGSLRTAPFRAPGYLRFFVSGFPMTSGLRIYLEDLDRRRTLDFRMRIDPGITWRERVWKIPAGWRGARVSWVVEDRSTVPGIGWIGVTLPEGGRDSFFHSLARAAYRTIFLVLDAILFLIPGASVALFALRRHRLEGFRVIALILAGSAIGGYAVFWAYLLGPPVGKAAAIMVMAASVIGILLQLRGRRDFVPRAVLQEVGLCWLIVTSVAVFYTAAGFLYFSDDGPGELAKVRFFAQALPPDNLLQDIFAERLYAGQSVLPTLLSEWHSSDRPPLQTAMVLMERPLWFVLTPGLHYQLFSGWLQCSWVAGVWVLMRSARVRNRWIVIALGFCVLSAFCWWHSFYVWPKMLAAAFCLIGLACFPSVRGDGSRWTFLDAVLAAAAMALSLLSHAGCGFTFAAFLLFMMARRGLPPVSQSAAAVGVLFALLLPWRSYQKFYDPPGDAIVKLHLSGAIDPQKTVWQSIRSAYGHLTFAQFLHNKTGNLLALWGDPARMFTAGDVRTLLERFLGGTFFALVITVGLLNAGFLARFFTRRGPPLRFADLAILTALFSVLFWCLVMFERGSTVVHQGSFAQVLLLFIGLALYLALASERVAYALLALQGIVVFPIFLFAKRVVQSAPGSVFDAPLDPGMLVAMVGALGGLIWIGYLAAKKDLIARC